MIYGGYSEIKKVVLILLAIYFQSIAVANESVSSNTSSKIALLTEYTAKYKVLRGGREYGNGIRSLAKNNNVYTLSLATSASAFFYSIDTRQTSRFSVYENDILPISYSSKDERSLKKTKRQFINFDYENNSITVKNKGKNWQADIVEQIYDPLLTIEVLRLNLNTKEVKMKYQVYDNAQIKEYVFVNNGIEIISTPLGDVECLKLTRIRKNSTRKTHIWFGKKYAFIPMKVLQEKGGDEVASMLLDSIEIKN